MGNLFIENNHDDGKGKYQSHECYIKGEFSSVQINCNIDIAIFGGSVEEVLDNKLITINKLLQDLITYKNKLLQDKLEIENGNN